MRPAPGDLFGSKYRIVRVIGDGGMGTVFEARHEVLGTVVALKFLHAELARRPGLSQRFLQEARVSANIQSIHVTRVTDVDSAPDGTPYLVMELLNGESLQQKLDRAGKLPPDQAIDFALQTLSGLEAAHALGVVHRDLKPDNVFVTPSSGGPLLKLIDFGIAKLRASNEFQRGLTRAGAMMGTPEYMAPEQLYSASEVDHRADLFSLGVILFEMLSGRRPADGDDAPAIVGKLMSGEILRLDALEPTLPPGLVEVVHKTISPERNDRYESAHDLRLALAPFAGELSHAGRLAATPHPALVAQVFAHESTRGPKDTSDEPLRESNVPRTLPPDDAPVPSFTPGSFKGSTEDVPAIDTVNERGSTEAAAPALRPGPVPVMVSGAWPPAPAGAPGPRRKSRTSTGVFAVLLGALVTGLIVAGLVGYRRSQPTPDATADAGPPPLTTLNPLNEPPTTVQTVGGQPTATPTNTAIVSHPPGTGPSKPPPPGSSTAAPSDAGATPVPTFPPFVFPSALPSSLPPLPSGFPTTLPTTFPTVFPPLFPGPPAAQPDGG